MLWLAGNRRSDTLEISFVPKNLFPTVDPQQAINKCPFLKLLAEDLLAIASRLQ